MSYRGRAEAFARKLHTRLRHLSTDDDITNRCKPDSDVFFDFELECESPSSPVEEYKNSREEDPFYEQEPTLTNGKDEPRKNGKTFTEAVQSNGYDIPTVSFTATFFTDTAPITRQPVRENGEPLFSAINFEECKGCDTDFSLDKDEVDSAPNRTKLINGHNNSPSPDEGDSDFESARSELYEGSDDTPIVSPVDNVVNGECRLKESFKSVTDSQTSEREKEGPVPIVIIDNKEQEIEFKNDLNVLNNVVDNDSTSSEEATAENTFEARDSNTDSDSDRPERVRRCSSLKTGKTPPGTPGRKKIVRFADVLGLDLADVKTFMDEIPVIPKSAYDDLVNADIVMISAPQQPRAPAKQGEKILIPLFQLSRDVTDVLGKQNVGLEAATVSSGPALTICGSVRVRNLDFHKTVHIRYTLDRWRTYTDIQAAYVQGSCDGYSDRFQFLLYAPSIAVGQRLELAVRFQCKGVQYWDNNCGANYCYDCLPLGSTATSLPPADNWQRSFY